MDSNVAQISKVVKRSCEKLDQSAEDLRQQMEKVFTKRVEDNKKGHLHDVVQGQ